MKKTKSTLAIVLGSSTLLLGLQVLGASGFQGAQKHTTPNIKIKLWDQFTAPADAKVMQTIINNFEKLHPNISISRTAMQDQSMQEVIKPALMSGQGPDLFAYDTGPGYLGVLAKDGQLLNLTSYAKSHGWYQRFPQWILHTTSINGQLYGLGNEVQALGVFYNKSIFSKYHLSVPKTYGQFLHVAQVLKKHHTVALELMDKDQWPGFHLESAFYTAIAGRQAVQNVIDLKTKAGWNQPIFAQALNDLRQLVIKGYTNPSPLAVSYDNGNNAFIAGKAAMDLTGSWMVTELYQKMGNKVGFFPLPPKNPSQPDIAPGGLGGAMLISKHTKNASAVESFLNYMLSDQTSSIWLNDNMIPPTKSAAKVQIKDSNPLFKQVVNVIDNPAGMSYSLDVLMPQQVNDVTQNDIQEVLAGTISDQQAVADKENALKQAIASGAYY